MNDLFSNSFKKYQDLKKQVQVDDLEGGQVGQPGTESIDLAKFFEDVENVKEDMKDVEKFHKKLQESNEESKLVHNAKTVKEIRSRMDADVSQVLKRVKMIKGKLEALERSNAAHRKISGCGPGSSADRTRTSVVSGLGKKLKVLMDDFQALRAKMNDEYKETVARRYFTVTGEKAGDELIENLISSGESESFLQKAIQEQGIVLAVCPDFLDVFGFFLFFFLKKWQHIHYLNFSRICETQVFVVTCLNLFKSKLIF